MLSHRATAVLIAGLALGGLVSCTGDPSLLDAADLTPLLLTAEETGIPGTVTRTLNEGENVPTQLPLAIPSLDIGRPCEDAVHAGLDARFLPHASSSAGYTVGQVHLELGLFSVAEDLDVRAIYGDILTECAEPVHDPTYDVTYSVHPLDSEYPGMRVLIHDGDGRIHESIVIQAEVGNHWVLAGAQRMSGEAVEQIVAAQIAKLEDGLNRDLWQEHSATR
ncbi:hypothetical protein EAH68_08435 [Corynebacterium hylobatis]|uniref:Sensor domain-containing protein n=1 Tax=Corynebacterium hylobatis TaxID=1859290 RepID=A0A3S0AW29_9CORY|nr:hypothetical protein [Corynebacterium hylobatis]RSZ63195.1 hypothetical protein EAH68_08435 [Corynebacterium hylobatis]